MVICLEQGADLDMAQLMPLPLAVSCLSKIQLGFTFLVPAHPGRPGKGAIKRVLLLFCIIVITTNALWLLYTSKSVCQCPQFKTAGFC